MIKRISAFGKENEYKKRTTLCLKQPIFSTLNQKMLDHPTPSDISHWWGFGQLAWICLVIQIVSGVFLSYALYTHVDLALNTTWEMLKGQVAPLYAC